MKQIRKLQLVFLAAQMPLAVACSDNERELKVEINAQAENFCEQTAAVVCHNTFQCCTGREIEERFGVEIATTEEDCRRDIGLVCEHATTKMRYAHDNELMEFDKRSADKCLQSLLAPEDKCVIVDQEQEDLTECSTVFKGVQRENKKCPFGIECEEGLYCGSDLECHKLISKGKECANGVCEDGLYCAFEEPLGKRVCKPQKGEGDKCESPIECASGTYCSIEANIDFEDENFKCMRSKTGGERCASDLDCLSARCLPGACTDGSSCFTDDECEGVCPSTNEPCNPGGYGEECAGVCATSNEPCYYNENCSPIVDENGDYAMDECSVETCKPSPCTGTPVCAEEYFERDYCQIDPLSIDLTSDDHQGVADLGGEPAN